MKEKLKQQYDSLYASDESLYGSGKAVKSVRLLPKFLEGGKVLDIGGGEGRNALYLVKKGYEVSVIDLSEVGLNNLDEAAKHAGVKINTQVADITETGVTEDFDGIVMSFVLHHINEEPAEKLIKDAQQHTNQSGINLIATFSDQGELFDRNEFKKRFYPSEQKLRDLYEGWEILVCNVKEATTRARNKDGERIKNGMIILLARKTAQT